MEFKVNGFISLKLEGGSSIIHLKKAQFRRYKRLLLQRTNILLKNLKNNRVSIEFDEK